MELRADVWTELIITVENVSTKEQKQLSFDSWPFWVTEAMISPCDIGVVVRVDTAYTFVLLRGQVIKFVEPRTIKVLEGL